MGIHNTGGFLRLQRGRMAKGGLAALLALFVVALMAGQAQAGTPAYSLSIKTGEGGSPLLEPHGMATDSAGNVYITTKTGAGLVAVEKFSSSGKYLAKFGAGTIGQVFGIDVDSNGNVWVASHSLKKLIKFSPTGTVLKEISTFAQPAGVAADGAGNVWWLAGDESTGTAWKVDASGTLVAGISALGYNVNSIDVDATGNVWITQTTESKVLEFNSGGGLIRSWVPAGGVPRGISADASGNLWVGFGSDVRKFSPLGAQLDKFGSFGGGTGQFLGMPRFDGVAVGPEGAIWVANETTEVQKWVPTP